MLPRLPVHLLKNLLESSEVSQKQINLLLRSLDLLSDLPLAFYHSLLELWKQLSEGLRCLEHKELLEGVNEVKMGDEMFWLFLLAFLANEVALRAVLKSADEGHRLMMLAALDFRHANVRSKANCNILLKARVQGHWGLHFKFIFPRSFIPPPSHLRSLNEYSIQPASASPPHLLWKPL